MKKMVPALGLDLTYSRLLDWRSNQLQQLTVQAVDIYR